MADTATGTGAVAALVAGIDVFLRIVRDDSDVLRVDAFGAEHLLRSFRFGEGAE